VKAAPAVPKVIPFARKEQAPPNAAASD